MDLKCQDIMMKSLYKDINWDKISYVGFDMDGTLYDEYQFISQVYKEISKLLEPESFLFMKKRWIEKGSSYQHIFSEAFDLYKINNNKATFIKEALNIFRNFDPKIKLNDRVLKILSYCKNNYKIFLITDGNPELQKKKFASLRLDKFFNKNYVLFTGINPNVYSKPKVESLKLLSIDAKKSVFFGDRDIDKQFSLNSKMQFQKVKAMKIV